MLVLDTNHIQVLGYATPAGLNLLQRLNASSEDVVTTVISLEVLHWLGEGKGNEAIAIILGISLRTVEKHVENIMTKLGVENRVEAALRAGER